MKDEDDKKENHINEQKIEKHKNGILNILKNRKYDLQEEIKNEIEKFLDIELKNHKITEEEYDILNEYLEELIQEELVKKHTEDRNKEFRKELKQLPIVDAITIYKGEFRGIAPQTKKNAGKQFQDSNNELEGEEK